MRPHARYAAYLARHKWFVLRAGLETGVPLWRLIIHDWSKLTRAEWGPYVRRFYAARPGVLEKDADPEDFHRAWTHHWHLNAHHWEHWLRFADDGSLVVMRMDDRFVREMVADWAGAGRAITGRWEVVDWYRANALKIRLHPETREEVHALLGIPSAQGFSLKYALSVLRHDREGA